MTIRFLLDTSVVSAPMRRVPDGNVIRRVEQHEDESAICAPVWSEMVYGVSRLPKGRRRERLVAYLEDVVARALPMLPYDGEAAGWHGRERARLEKQGRPAPFIDGQIAAIARTNGLTVATTNPKHFARFSGLAVQDWSRRARMG